MTFKGPIKVTLLSRGCTSLMVFSYYIFEILFFRHFLHWMTIKGHSSNSRVVYFILNFKTWYTLLIALQINLKCGSPRTPISGTPVEQWAVNGH